MSEPPGAQVFVDDGAAPSCHTPCQLTIQIGAHRVRVVLEGFNEEERAVAVKATNKDLVVSLQVLRGIVTVEMPAGGALKINGQAVDTSIPAPLSLLPGLYKFSADFGAVRRERMLTVKPGARLRLALAP